MPQAPEPAVMGGNGALLQNKLSHCVQYLEIWGLGKPD